MLADDVTKVMDEQHMLEGQYGDLIAKRSELKGISKKPDLIATKKEIAVRINSIKAILEIETVSAHLKFCFNQKASSFKNFDGY